MSCAIQALTAINDLNFGVFLIYFTPGYRVFIDDGCELYGDARLTEYSEAANSDPCRIESWRKTYPFNLALVQRNSPFDQYLSHADYWDKVADDGIGVLYRYSESRLTQLDSE